MKANTSNQVALLSLGLLFLASFQVSNALAPSPSKSSTVVKVPNAASPVNEAANSGSQRDAITSGGRRSPPIKTTSPPTTSSPLKTSPQVCRPRCEKCSVTGPGDRRTCTACKPGYVLRQISAQNVSSRATPNSGGVRQLNAASGGRRMSRFILWSRQLKVRSLREDGCEPCGYDKYACEDVNG